MAGYSKNPLWKKLSIKKGYCCFLFNSPTNYFDLLEGTPNETAWSEDLEKGPFDFMHVFLRDEKILSANWDAWKSALKTDGTIWISCPKGSSKIETNLNGNLVREVGLKGGLVDVKVCAVDQDWSGLKFMFRKKDR